MHYLGGKSRTAVHIASYLNSARGKVQPYWEPFVGSAWVLVRIDAPVRYASDKQRHLISLWQALQQGWDPPMNITEDMYNRIKANRDDYPPELVAFVGFGCSWGGKWFGGYARDHKFGRNYAEQARNSLLRKLRLVLDVRFFCADFMEADPPEDEMQIYCDPPYEGTTGYGAIGRFDHRVFWERCRQLQSMGHDVFVSEYSAPEDFECVLSVNTTTAYRGSDNRPFARKEMVFAHKSAMRAAYRTLL